MVRLHVLHGTIALLHVLLAGSYRTILYYAASGLRDLREVEGQNHSWQQKRYSQRYAAAGTEGTPYHEQTARPSRKVPLPARPVWHKRYTDVRFQVVVGALSLSVGSLRRPLQGPHRRHHLTSPSALSASSGPLEAEADRDRIKG